MDKGVTTEAFLFGAFRLDRRAGALFRCDERGATVPVAIGSRGFAVLDMLVARHGELVSKNEIMRAVWSETVVEDNNLTVQISALRRVLDRGRAQGSCIQTIPGRGYRFVAPVTRFEADALVSAPGFGEGWDGTLAVVGQPYRQSAMFPIDGSAEAPTPSAPDRLSAAPRLSIVVLPFANLSNDPEQQYFVDGITEDLTTDLSRIGDSFVIARTTAFTYRGKTIDVRQVARELGVRYVLEGSVRRLGERVQVNVQLIDGETGTHVWADRFDADRRDLAETQGEITGRLAATLNAELIKDIAHRIEQERVADPDARDLVMRARALRMQSSEADGRARAMIIDLLEHALIIVPGSIDARIELARVLAGAIADGFSSSAQQDEARAEQLIREALERDPNRSRARGVMGLVRRLQGRWAESQVEWETAIALDRNSAWAVRQLGQTMMIQGYPEAAIPYLEKAIRLDPRAHNIYMTYNALGRCHLFLGRIDEAVDLSRRAQVLAPGIFWAHLQLAGALGLRGDISEAKRAIIEAVKLTPDINCITRYAAYSVTAGFGHPTYRAMSEKTIHAGLRVAGFPEN